jgi:hypothetical protein
VLLWALACGAAAADDAAAAKAPGAAPDSRATVTTVVAGIVSYTRWPTETKSIRLCTIGRGPGVDELLSAADLGSAQQSVPVHAARGANALSECDAIYVGALATSTSRNLLQSLAGRPLLMIGEGHEFCTDGGMFCLQPGASEVGFAVNLDAVARSGLRVNPRVLRMARHATGSGP